MEVNLGVWETVPRGTSKLEAFFVFHVEQGGFLLSITVVECSTWNNSAPKAYDFHQNVLFHVKHLAS